MNDLITVIVPVYKVEQYLPRCVDSILAQTYQNLEIFLVDDGSPDRCGQICDEYAAKDGRVHVIHKQNGGLSDARNAALDICTGKYISFIDSDDYVSKDFIESLYKAIQNYHTKLSICGVNRIDEHGNTTIDYSPSKTEKCAAGNEMMETIWRPSACNKLYHRSLFIGIRYPYGKLYEDLFIYHDILSLIDQVSFTGRQSYFYFSRPGSIINKEYDNRNTDLIEGLDLRIKRLRCMKYNDLADRQLPFLFNRTLEAFCKLNKCDIESKNRLQAIERVFSYHFGEMMSYNGFSVMQKVKILLFRYMPRFYIRIIGSGL